MACPRPYSGSHWPVQLRVSDIALLSRRGLLLGGPIRDRRPGGPLGTGLRRARADIRQPPQRAR